MGSKAGKPGEIEGIDCKFTTGEVIYYKCSISPGVCVIEGIAWWDEPCPEIFGKRRLPFYRIRNIETDSRNDEFEANLDRDNIGMLLYG